MCTICLLYLVFIVLVPLNHVYYLLRENFEEGPANIPEPWMKDSKMIFDHIHLIDLTMVQINQGKASI